VAALRAASCDRRCRRAAYSPLLLLSLSALANDRDNTAGARKASAAPATTTASRSLRMRMGESAPALRTVFTFSHLKFVRVWSK
jgi:hypothetical protein